MGRLWPGDDLLRSHCRTPRVSRRRPSRRDSPAATSRCAIGQYLSTGYASSFGSHACPSSAKEPKERFQTAGQFANALAGALRGERLPDSELPGAATPTSAKEPVHSASGTVFALFSLPSVGTWIVSWMHGWHVALEAWFLQFLSVIGAMALGVAYSVMIRTDSRKLTESPIFEFTLLAFAMIYHSLWTYLLFVDGNLGTVFF